MVNRNHGGNGVGTLLLDSCLRDAKKSKCRGVAVVINGVPLLDLVREVERPICNEELQQRVANGEPEEEVRLPPAAYMYAARAVLARGGGVYFGKIDEMFALDKGDPSWGKTCVLGCDCGDPGCWPLLARIERSDHEVIWSDFSQFHRDWKYQLGPFRFSRSEYEAEIERFSR